MLWSESYEPFSRELNFFLWGYFHPLASMALKTSDVGELCSHFSAPQVKIMLKKVKTVMWKSLNLLGAETLGTAAPAWGSGAELTQRGRMRCRSVAMEKLGQTPQATKWFMLMKYELPARGGDVGTFMGTECWRIINKKPNTWQETNPNNAQVGLVWSERLILKSWQSTHLFAHGSSKWQELQWE